MITQIKYKLECNVLCDLSIQELKILYGIDCAINKELIKYIEKRDNYKDFVTMFCSNKVATKLDEINENTVALVGDYITIDEILPTYNLKYLCCNLVRYELNTIYNLENLEIVYGSILLNSIEKYMGLENLEIVTNVLDLQNLEGENDLSNLKYVHYLDATGTYDSTTLPINMDSLCLSMEHANNLSLKNDLLELQLPNIKNLKGVHIPSSLKILDLSSVESLDDLILPKELKTLYIKDIKLLRGCELSDNISVFVNTRLLSEDELNKVATIVTSKVMIKKQI